MHGINLGGWLSQCDHTKERYDTFIVEDDIKVIAGWGLDHVRLPIDYDLVETDEGNYMEEGFAYIDKAISWCEKYGLNMILDLHKTYGFSFDKGEEESGFFENEKYQERFYRLWEELASRYGRLSDRLCFELLNEVTDKDYCDTWNHISAECIRRIRAVAPDIKILIGSYWNNAIDGLKDLAAPYDDKIVYNFHCYEPLVFTHQGGPWVEGMDTSFRMPMDSTYGEYEKYNKANLTQYSADLSSYDKDAVMGIEYFENLVEEAVKVAEERDVALYCGEYGVIDLATPEDTLKWYKLITSCFEKHGIARSAWTYKEMDFGVSSEKLSGIREELVKLL